MKIVPSLFTSVKLEFEIKIIYALSTTSCYWLRSTYDISSEKRRETRIAEWERNKGMPWTWTRIRDVIPRELRVQDLFADPL